MRTSMLLAAAAVVLAGSSVHSATMDFQASGSASIVGAEWHTHTEFNHESFLKAGGSPGWINCPFRTVLTFDLDALPSGATVNSVKLVMRWYGANGDDDTALALHHLAVTPRYDLDVNWDQYGNDNTTHWWTTAGGDFSSTILAGVSDYGEGLTWGSPVTFDSSDEFVSAVSSLQDGSGAYGTFNLMLKAVDDMEEEPRWMAQFYSSRHDDLALRPVLAIDYTAIPEPMGATVAGLSSLLLLRRRRK